MMSSSQMDFNRGDCGCVDHGRSHDDRYDHAQSAVSMQDSSVLGLKEYITGQASLMVRSATDALPHPYVVPSTPDSPIYSSDLWDWDSWWASVAMTQIELDLDDDGCFLEATQGSILDFLDRTDDNGITPIMLYPNGKGFESVDPTLFDEEHPFDQNMHKPILAQAAAMLIQQHGDASWIADRIDALERFLTCYLTHHVHKETGLAYWQTDFAVGVDNDPSIFFRPDKSAASIFLNSLLYRELMAFGYILETLGKVDESIAWREKARALRDAINTYCWDERDGTYYSVDLNLRPVDESRWLHHGAPRSWPCLLMRIDSWSSFAALWAGIPDECQAKRMVGRYRETATFNARYGVRTLSRLEPQYMVRSSNNPSCWLGPIWGVSNYMVFRGLQKYGFLEDARELACKTIRLFANDFAATGCLHEYYDPDTGEPVMTAGFQNWNFLAVIMIDWLDGKPVRYEF
ncbi:amylo-alpha-1,6-glucosidase [Bifidobacterium simiarum]|nr:trehalase family glycosidase [Bifidobacterium simiarum]